MTQRNPWVDGAATTELRDRPAMEGEDWREWLPGAPTPAVEPVDVAEEAEPVQPPTGPSTR